METNESFCRVCLNWAQCEINLESSLEIDDTSCEIFRTYLDFYCFVAQVNAELHENISNKLCKKCGVDLRNAYTFITKVQKAEQILQQLLPAVDPLEVSSSSVFVYNASSSKQITIIEAADYEQEELENTEILDSEKEENTEVSSTSVPIDSNTCSKQNTNIKQADYEQENPGNAGIHVSENIRLSQEILVSLFECDICGKGYSSTKKLNIHRRKHEFAPTTCDVCNKKFATKYYMRLHMSTHEEQRSTFDCSECGKKYCSENSLAVHKRIHRNLFECDECHKQFLCNRELRVHKNSHKRFYQFVCDICGARYLRQNHLNTHMIRHTGLKAQCEECGKLFNTKRGLHEHSFTHTGTTPYPCSFCERGFPCRQKYRLHLKSVHRKELTEDEVRRCMEKWPRGSKKIKVNWVTVDK